MKKKKCFNIQCCGIFVFIAKGRVENVIDSQIVASNSSDSSPHDVISQFNLTTFCLPNWIDFWNVLKLEHLLLQDIFFYSLEEHIGEDLRRFLELLLGPCYCFHYFNMKN